MDTASPDYPMLCPVCNTGTPGGCDCLPADETDAEKRMNKSEQKPCGCRPGECETKADHEAMDDMAQFGVENREALAQQAVPEGFALVPLRMNKAMQYITEQEDWTWEDLLAAAEAITEDQYTKIAAAPAAPQASPANTPTHEHLSTMIGMVLGARQRGKMEYADGSVMDKNVKAAIEHLKDWPYPEQAAPQAEQQAQAAIPAPEKIDALMPVPMTDYPSPGEAVYSAASVREAIGAALAAQQAECEPLTLDEVRLMTCMHSGAPWHDQMVQVVRELLVIYEDLRAQNKRPFDPADLEGDEHDAYFRRLEQLLSRPAT